MLQHLVHVACPSRLPALKDVMERMKAKPLERKLGPHEGAAYLLKHHLLDDIVLRVHFITDLDGVAPHLRNNPVDLLIYDERGEHAVEAMQAMRRLRTDVRSLAELWGPDFLFPMNRIVTILEGQANQQRDSERAFDLGRMQVRDVLINPSSTVAVLLWLRRILHQGIKRENKVGLGLSGGGIEGFLYQIGVLAALSRAIGGRPFHDLDMISGISSGAIAGAMMAAKAPIEEVIRSLHQDSEILPPLTSGTLFDVAVTDIFGRFLKESINLAKVSPTRWFANTTRSIPTGFFKGERLEEYFRAAFKAFEQDDDFATMPTKLVVGATDQDTFEHVAFGIAPWERVPVSEALRASCALPPVFTPKKIGGRMFIDGQVTRSCDLQVAVEQGCRLLFVIDPFRPHSQNTAGLTDQQGGFYNVVQTIKALCSTRFETEMKHVSEIYADVDFIVFQPDDDCARLMAGSPMRYKIRTQLIELAYLCTLRRLRERHHVYSVKMARFGYNLASLRELKALESSYHEILKSAS